MFRRAERLRPLRVGTLELAARLAARDPLVNTLVGFRLRELGRSAPALAEEFCVTGPEEDPTALLWHGANVSTVAADEAALALFADRLASQRRRAGSIVGVRGDVERLWTRLAPAWGPARELRWSQPLLEATAAATVPEAEELRPAVPGEEQIVFPASVAMFREEVGVDPTVYDGGRSYLRRVGELIAAQRTYVVVRDGRVAFKADVGAVFGGVAQIHGVWVDPALRGEGLARRAMVATVRRIRATTAPRVSLYVNSYNVPARRAYAAAGFREHGQLATILF